ncbi:hypothetical protein CU254_00440 [Amycolatopsis sp. AA4]|nr:hypothetical protein CU254_00440 [Amycolatopsis sp. AA4]EFL04415.1 predicted protein [Streptomyces sp. AA4]
MGRISCERITLVILHRLTTAQTADRIVVTRQSQIAETGTREALLAANGEYARLWGIHREYVGWPR